MIKLKNVSKYYYNKGIIASGFTKINLEFNIGEFIAITGESGSGKSTLLNVISGLDSYEEGEMYIGGEETSHYTEKDFQDYRRKYIANIFQNFNLVNSYTVYQNIELVLLLNGLKKKDVKKRVLELIRKVDLYKFRNTKVSKLSGGQKQRVAIARCLAKDCPIILADEPTGNLDSRSSRSIIKLLSEISKDKLVIIVTHNYEQVEEYVTRKIKMHDGRVLEDITLKDTENEDQKQVLNNYKDITFLNKVRLGFRNAFNIIPKFLLVLGVYLFITFALLGEYSYFQKDEYIESKSGYNNYFMNTSDKRIIIKKDDRTSFTNEEFDKISHINNVEYVVKNDVLLDTSINITDNNNLWLNGIPSSLSNFNNKVDIGRMPERDTEILISGYKDDYYLGYQVDTILNSTVYLQNLHSGVTDYSNPLTIVGIHYKGDEAYSYYDNTIYVSDNLMNILSYEVNQNYSGLKVFYADNYFSDVSIFYNDNVPVGGVFVPEDVRGFYSDLNPINKKMSVLASNIYYNEELDLTISNVYNNTNCKKLLGVDNIDNYYNTFFINPFDYNNLFNKDSYQASVFVRDVNKTNEVIDTLNNDGYNTLLIKDTLVNYDSAIILGIMKTIVTIFLVVVLFFISYFVIRIILKSRNVYFATIRMLGGSKGVLRNLLVIELFIVSSLAYLLFILLIILNYKNVIDSSFLHTCLEYLMLKDYILMYFVVVFLSYIISIRFSSRLFKYSANKTLREEV